MCARLTVPYHDPEAPPPENQPPPPENPDDPPEENPEDDELQELHPPEPPDDFPAQLLMRSPTCVFGRRIRAIG